MAIVFVARIVFRQTDSGGRDLVEDLLSQRTARSRLERADVNHLLIGRLSDLGNVRFEPLKSQETVMVSGKFLRRNSQPLFIWVERVVFAHVRSGSP